MNRYERKFVSRQRSFKRIRTDSSFQYSRDFTLAKNSNKRLFLYRAIFGRTETPYGPTNYLFYHTHARLCIFIRYYFLYKWLARLSWETGSHIAKKTKKIRKFDRDSYSKPYRYYSYQRRTRKQHESRDSQEQYSEISSPDWYL